MELKTQMHIFNGSSYAIGVMLPDGFDITKTYALKAFCHGQGEKGVGSEVSLASVTNFLNGTPLPMNSLKAGFILIYTQINVERGGNWTNDYIEAMLDYAKRYLIDFKVLTGASLGGGAVWQYASANPKGFNVYEPVCPIWGMSNPKGIAASGANVWAFHAEDDSAQVPAETTKTYIAQIRDEKPIGDIRFTLYSTGGHYIWNTAYGEAALYEWEVALRNKKTPTGIPPPPPPPVQGATAIAEVKNITGTTATLDGSKSTGANWAAWEMITPKPSAHAPVFPNWAKGGLVRNVENLLPGTNYVFRLTINGSITNDVSFTTPAKQPEITIIATSDIPTGKTKVSYMSDGNFRFS